VAINSFRTREAAGFVPAGALTSKKKEKGLQESNQPKHWPDLAILCNSPRLRLPAIDGWKQALDDRPTLAAQYNHRLRSGIKPKCSASQTGTAKSTIAVSRSQFQSIPAKCAWIG